MFILLTIFLFLFTSLAMLIFYLVRPKFGIQGFLAVLAVLTAWPMVFLARSDIPREISILDWKPAALFPVSPTLLIDQISWLFALAVVTISLAAILTSIAELGQSSKEQTQAQPIIEVIEDRKNSQVVPPTENPLVDENHGITSNWQSWAGMLIMTSLGLVAVTAGNIVTLLIAWSAIDICEVFILISYIRKSKPREQVVQIYAARIAGQVFLFVAAIMLWSQGAPLTFAAVTPSIGLLLVLSAGLRLGIIPPHLPFIQVPPLRRGLGTILRLIPAASSYILLVRVAVTGILGGAVVLLLLLIVLIGFFAAGNWQWGKDELSGRPYWLLGTASLIVASAILKQPVACLTWSIASLLSGSLIFSMSLRHRNLLPIILIGLINFSALPFSPTWRGTEIYIRNSVSAQALSPYLFYLFSFSLLLIQSFLLAGYIGHSLRGLYPATVNKSGHIERWVWFIYPICLVAIVGTHILIGISLVPDLSSVAFPEWIMGAAASVIAGLIWYLSLRYLQPSASSPEVAPAHIGTEEYSFDWLYRLVGRIFRAISRFVTLLSTILEGEGGLLWALVLFALIFVFLQR